MEIKKCKISGVSIFLKNGKMGIKLLWDLDSVDAFKTVLF